MVALSEKRVASTGDWDACLSAAFSSVAAEVTSWRGEEGREPSLVRISGQALSVPSLSQSFATESDNGVSETSTGVVVSDFFFLCEREEDCVLPLLSVPSVDGSDVEAAGVSRGDLAFDVEVASDCFLLWLEWLKRKTCEAEGYLVH